ncbi:peptidoglycan-binding domain-containing protein [Paracoccus seriniphilus]|uniref:Peptidoglycan binding domain-containing protein n=1 Tax=Paracoccus seriniphilus TaxID=184748 RepID=A0A239PUK8_9RHOB|nr:peptidoglycan-binding domain-containing protein [Paracoccus seriniphilus]WCR16253.1 peptidoglycan-binding protein [Paracoccus seriniphilus]SNT73808.1 hypothetical protein SAMN05444959_105254 [Paracoccus seriniphilus]
MKALLLPIVLFLAAPVTALAEPCVGSNFDRALPGAVNVQRRTSDVPTARYPGIWQEGRVAGYAYQIASDYSALLTDRHDSPSWQIAVICEAGAESCEISTEGQPDASAGPIAEALGRCLLGQPVSSADFSRPAHLANDGLPLDVGITDPERSIDSVAAIATAAGVQRSAEQQATDGTRTPASGNDPEADRPAAIPDPVLEQPTETAAERASNIQNGPSLVPDQPCGLQLIEPGTSTVQTLQRLLTAAGFQPGTDDGVMGRRTRQALTAALGEEAATLSIEEAIRALNKQMCQE